MTLGRMKKSSRARRPSSTKMHRSRRDVIAYQRIKPYQRRRVLPQASVLPQAQDLPQAQAALPETRMDVKERKGRGLHKRTAGQRHAHSRATHATGTPRRRRRTAKPLGWRDIQRIATGSPRRRQRMDTPVRILGSGPSRRDRWMECMGTSDIGKPNSETHLLLAPL